MPMRMFRLPLDGEGDEPIEITPTPAVVAQVDQDRAAAEETLSTLLMATILDHIYANSGDDDFRVNNVKAISELLLGLERPDAIGVITVAVEHLAHAYIDDHGGIDDVANKLHAGAHRADPDDCPFPDSFHKEE